MASIISRIPSKQLQRKRGIQLQANLINQNWLSHWLRRPLKHHNKLCSLKEQWVILVDRILLVYPIVYRILISFLKTSKLSTGWLLSNQICYRPLLKMTLLSMRSRIKSLIRKSKLLRGIKVRKLIIFHWLKTITLKNQP